MEEVRSILYGIVSQENRVLVCAVHWGEIAGILYRKKGLQAQQSIQARLSAIGLEVVSATGDRAIRASRIKIDLKIPYADPFGVELAESVPCTFVTADYDLKPAAHRVKIQFLPRK